MTSERVYTVPWFPELARVPALPGYPSGQQLNGMGLHFTMMVAVLVRKAGPLPPVMFGIAVGDLFRSVPDLLATDVARGSISTARRLGLIEERDGMIVASETLMRTRAWWES